MLCMRYFGTDGIRGLAGELLTENIPYLLGRALSATGGKVLVARDVRESSPAIEKELVRGLLSGESEIALAGVLPTPALAYIAKAHDARFAVMITASHNPPQFNGLKVFSGRGRKLSAREEEALDAAIGALREGRDIAPEEAEALAADVCARQSALPHRVRVLEGAEDEYISHVTSMFPRFDGMSATIDAACGCMAGVATKAFEALGIRTAAINNVRDGKRVNVGCGSTHLDALLRATPADEIGFAFDGDGDRALAAVNGAPYDGDAILLALALLYRVKGKLRKKLVVGTELTNSRLQRELARINTALLRTPVGDKYVLGALLEHGCLLGGEKSGHILTLDRADTGDGLVTALSLLETIKTLGALPDFNPYPLTQFDIYSPDPRADAESPKMKERISLAKAQYGESGRFVIRPSGTEPYIRVAYECFDGDAKSIFDGIKKIFEVQ